MSEQNAVRLAFLDTSMFEDGAVIRGATLITDSETRPCEFRCTSPIKPTSLQRVLYGDTLDEYILAELIGIPLMKAVKEEAGIVLVQNPSFLQIRPSLPCPVVLVSRGNESALPQDALDAVKPVLITSHREYPAEAGAARQMLSALMQKRDLLEPFERVRVALAEAHKQKVGDSTPGTTRA